MDDIDLGATIRGFSPGQKLFARYHLQRILGRGGMGVVWLARDEKLERDVALKFLPEFVKSDRAAMDDLKRETRRALELTHSHIIRIYDFVEDAQTAAIAMEYVSGDTLSNRRMERPGHVFEPADLGRWVWQLCEALAYAHDKARIVHRDLKPANLMLDAHGDLKVADFGIARSISDSVSRLSAQAGSSGTPAYMSPQQMMGEKPDVADDIYSLGATLYELLTGKPPFYSGNLIAQVQAKVPPGLAARRAEMGLTGAPVPQAWEETIAACLAKEAAQRPAGARDVARRLGLGPGFSTAPFPVAAAASPPSRATAPVVATAENMTAQVSLPKSGKSPLLFAAATVGLLLVLAAGYYYGVHLPREETARREAETAVREAERQATERAVTDLRTRIAAGQATRAELEVIAREQTTRGAVAREQLQVLQREQELAEQQARQVVLVALERLADNSPRPVLDELELQVRTYLAAAPERFRDEVQKNWERRRTAWLAHEAANRPGSLLVETDPAGATVTLYPRNERKSSPAFFKDLKPGEVSLRVEKDGYEAQDVPFTVKAGTDHRADLLRLAPLYGGLAVTSDPLGLAVVIEGNGRRHEGRTPFTQANLPPGAYRVTFQRDTWQPVTRNVTVEKGRDAVANASLRGHTLEINAAPAGAAVSIDGRPAGTVPLRFTEMESRSYRLEFSLEGHEPQVRTLNLTRDETLGITLSETPGYRLLRALSAHEWRTEAWGGWAVLKFDPQGNITGEHKIMLAPVMQDRGKVVRVDPDGRSLVATFTPSAPFVFYMGDCTIELIDADNFEMRFSYNGNPQKMKFVRPGATRPVKMKIGK